MTVSALDTPSTWNHTVIVLLCRLFTQHSVFKLTGALWPGLRHLSSRFSKSPWISSAFCHLGPIPCFRFTPSLGGSDGGGQASASPSVVRTLKSQIVNRTRPQGELWPGVLEAGAGGQRTGDQNCCLRERVKAGSLNKMGPSRWLQDFSLVIAKTSIEGLGLGRSDGLSFNLASCLP